MILLVVFSKTGLKNMYFCVDLHLHHCIEGHLSLKWDISEHCLASKLFCVLWEELALVQISNIRSGLLLN